jgi:hypothetical protein
MIQQRRAKPRRAKDVAKLRTFCVVAIVRLSPLIELIE